MTGNKSLFSELNGFVIYDPKLLHEYLENNNLKDNNILKYFTETNHGDFIVENGIVIPMMDIDSDYYNFSVVEKFEDKIILHNKFSSKDWIIQIVSGEININGIGYFNNIKTLNENNVLKFYLKNGWYEVEIIGGNVENKLFYEIILTKKDIKPKYNGDINFSYKL
jgi:hypothetical protein